MSTWLWAHAGALAAALGRLARHPFAGFFEILVLGIALSLPVGLFLVVETARGFASQLPSDPQISLFLARDLAPDAVKAVGAKLAALPDVEAVTFVGRQQAAAQLRKSTAMAEVLDALPDNPLPDAFTVRLANEDAGRVEELQTSLAKWPGVEIVHADSGWVRKLQTGIEVARLGAALLGGMFVIAALTITFNTVRLQMLGRREEIQLSRLIGATDAFVRRPFVYFGAAQGLLGGAAALAIVAAAYAVIAGPLLDFSTAYGVRVAPPQVPVEWIGVFLVGTAALGALTAWVAATRHLWVRDLRRAT